MSHQSHARHGSDLAQRAAPALAALRALGPGQWPCLHSLPPARVPCGRAGLPLILERITWHSDNFLCSISQAHPFSLNQTPLCLSSSLPPSGRGTELANSSPNTCCLLNSRTSAGGGGRHGGGWDSQCQEDMAAQSTAFCSGCRGFQGPCRLSVTPSRICQGVLRVHHLCCHADRVGAMFPGLGRSLWSGFLGPGARAVRLGVSGCTECSRGSYIQSQCFMVIWVLIFLLSEKRETHMGSLLRASSPIWIFHVAIRNSST